MRLLSMLATAFALTRVVYGLTSDLTAVTAFKSTAQDVAMYVYVPATVAAKPAIVVAVHSCERNAQYYFDNTGYAALADAYGYMVIYPNSSAQGECWDTTSTASLTHEGGGHSQAIADMVSYSVTNYNGDAKRVAVTGTSSGGIMVNLLAGLYPNVFQAGSVFSGEPGTVFTNSIWPYTGSRPKMMIWHGTIDILYTYYPQFTDELSGWSNVLDVTFTQNITDSPVPGYTKMIYGDGMKLVGISAAGVGHTVPVDAVSDLAWFCIFPECDANGVPKTSTTSSTTSTTSTTSSSSTIPISPTTPGSSIATGLTSPAVTSPTISASSSTGTSANDAIASETLTPVPIAAHSTLSAGAKAGIGIASISAAFFFILAAVFLVRKRRQARGSNLEHENAMMSSEPEGHEMHPGYGVVPIHDATPASPNVEKHQGQMDSEPTAMSGLLAYKPGEYNRESTTSTLLPPHSMGDEQRYSTTSTLMLPHSMGDDQRYSTTSTTMLLPHSPREDQRQSTTSTLLLSRSPEGDERQSAQDVPEQDVSEMLLNVDNEEMSEIPLNADKPKHGANL